MIATPPGNWRKDGADPPDLTTNQSPTVHYGDLPQDPQDAAKEARMEADAPPDKILPDFLWSFCADESKPSLSRPFNSAGYLWATDGKIIVRVPQIPGYENKPDVIYPAAEKVWVYDPVEFGPMPQLPDDAGYSGYCKKCAGMGYTTCDKCGCDPECDTCKGNGQVDDPRWMRIQESERLFRIRYLLKISWLPNVQVSRSSCSKALRFRFDGGEGVLMGSEDKFCAGDDEWKPEPAAADSKEAA